jgi:hypothetical protein
MSIVDERGRVFGKINLIDLGLLLFVAVLVPLGYGAYVLFRQPPPRLIAVTPTTVVPKKGVEQRVQIRGEYLQPFLKAALGKIAARAFLVATPESGELLFTDVPPGTYDLVLSDENQEVARLPNALTIAPLAPPSVQVLGWFVGPTAGRDGLVDGAKFGPSDSPVAEVLVLEPPEPEGRRRAALRVSCGTPEKACAVAGVSLEAGKSLDLHAAGGAGDYTFLVDEVRVDGLWTDLRVRLVGLPEVLDLVHPGDVDRHLDPGGAVSVGITRGAVLTSVGQAQENQGTFNIVFNQNLPGLDAFTANTSAVASLPMQGRIATVRLPVERVAMGWGYRDSLIRPGSVLMFETENYVLRAVILGMSKPAVISPGRGRS